MMTPVSEFIKFNKIVIYKTLVLITLISMSIFLIYTYKWANFNSDSAVKVLLAQEMYDVKEFFPKTWNYYNGDIFIFYGNTLIVFLIKIVGPGFWAHAIAGLIFGVFFLSATFLLIRRVGTEPERRLVGIALICSGISFPITEQLWAQTGNGIVYGFICVFLYFSIQLVFDSKEIRTKTWALIGLFFFLFIATWSNPSRTIFFYIVPITIAMVLALNSFNETHNKTKHSTYYKILITVISSIVLAVALREATMSNITMNMGYAGQVRWVSIVQASEALARLPFKLFTLLGAEAVPSTLIFTTIGLYQSIRLCVAIIAIILIIEYMYRNIVVKKNQIDYFLAVFLLISLSQISFLHIFTTINHINYFIPVLALALVLTAVDNVSIGSLGFYKQIRNITVFVIITNTLAIHYKPFWTNFHILDPLVTSFGEFSSPNSLIKYLKDNELTDGFSTFWRAGRLTVLSGGEVRIRSIEINEGKLSRDFHLSSKNWYAKDDSIGRRFLMLNESEESNINWTALNAAGLVVDRVLKFEKLKIFIFEKNFTKHLN